MIYVGTRINGDNKIFEIQNGLTYNTIRDIVLDAYPDAHPVLVSCKTGMSTKQDIVEYD